MDPVTPKDEPIPIHGSSARSYQFYTIVLMVKAPARWTITQRFPALSKPTSLSTSKAPSHLCQPATWAHGPGLHLLKGLAFRKRSGSSPEELAIRGRHDTSSLFHRQPVCLPLIRNPTRLLVQHLSRADKMLSNPTCPVKSHPCKLLPTATTNQVQTHTDVIMQREANGVLYKKEWLADDHSPKSRLLAWLATSVCPREVSRDLMRVERTWRQSHQWCQGLQRCH